MTKSSLAIAARRSQHIIPLRLVLEQNLAQQTNWRHAVIEQLIVKLFQREIGTLLRLVIVAQLQNLHFAQTVIQVAVVEGAAHRFTARGLFFVVAIFSKEF